MSNYSYLFHGGSGAAEVLIGVASKVKKVAPSPAAWALIQECDRLGMPSCLAQS